MIQIVKFQGVDVRFRLGVHEFEQHASQRVLIDLVVEIDHSMINFFKAQTIDQTWDYDCIYEYIHLLSNEPHVELQETIASRIYKHLKSIEEVKRVMVYVRKPDVYEDVMSVGVQITDF